MRSLTLAGMDVLKADGAVIKWLSDVSRKSRTEVLGSAAPPPLTISEGDARFECRLNEGVQTGLFLDHRPVRWRARTYAAGVEVLNLFAYTCTFSVHAALAGASRVTSIDVSSRALQWGRRNMSMSGVDPDQHRWFADDVVMHLRRTRRSYGLVILDPPVYGHGRRPFSLLSDIGALLAGAMNQLKEGGILIASTHHLELNGAALLSRARRAAQSLGLELEVIDELGLPEWDHPVLPGHRSEEDRGDYLATLIARVKRGAQGSSQRRLA